MRTPFGSKTLADFGFAPLLNAVRLTCLDVGARGGFTQDLLPLAPAVRAIGFEPDRDECARLNSAAGDKGPWRELQFVPLALGRAKESRSLNIYRKRGCSSLLTADQALAGLYGRDGYYILDEVVEVPTTTADAAAREYDFADAAFIKLDVQGAELEILEGAEELLRNALLALRVEVSFIPIYRDQPLFADIDRELRRRGFLPMRFLELHPWRRSSKAKLPNLDAGPYPYSEGQLIHGDVLYLRDPEDMSEDGDAAVEQLIRAALIALAYGLVDHARAIFDRAPVKADLQSRFGIDADKATSMLSKHLARNSRTAGTSELLPRLKRMVGGSR